MNDKDRKAVAALEARYNLAVVAFNQEKLAVVARLLEMVQDQRDRFERLPESLQYATVGTELETAADELQEIADELDCLEVESAEGWVAQRPGPGTTPSS